MGEGVPPLLKDPSSFLLGTKGLGLPQLPWRGTVLAHSRYAFGTHLLN